MVFICKGLTFFLGSLDVGINQLSKDKLKDVCINYCMNSGDNLVNG